MTTELKEWSLIDSPRALRRWPAAEFCGDVSQSYRGRPRQDCLALFRHRLCQRDNWTCQICGEALGADIHLDHVVPKSHGGEFTWDNLRATHSHCNCSRGNGDREAELTARLEYYAALCRGQQS